MARQPSTETRRASTSPDRTQTLLQALPPHAIEAEMSLLGSMLIDPDVIGDVLMIVRAGDAFYKPANGAIFTAMIELYDRNASLDIVQLNQVLTDRSILDAVGGLDYLVEVAQSVPSASNAAHYARLVRDKAMIRELISVAGRILADAHERSEDPVALLNDAESQIFQIAQRSEHHQAESLRDLIEQAMTMIQENEGRALTGVPTGFAKLDEILGGMQRGEMLVLAARPSMGKTALALNIAENAAMHGNAVAIFSLEMSRQQLVQRLLSARSGVDGDRLRRHMLRTEDYKALMRACDELHDTPIFIDDTAGLTLMQLRAKARRLKQKHDIKAVVVDYLQLMTAGHRVESRQQEVSEISRGVKAMARELDVPVVCLSQLNRAAEQREGHRPRMSDLRESGSIEQDADVVAMLHREEYYHNDPDWRDENPEKCNLGEVIIAKQRNGPTGLVQLTWDSRTTCFRDLAPMHASPDSGGAPPWQPRASAQTPDTYDDLPV